MEPQKVKKYTFGILETHFRNIHYLKTDKELKRRVSKFILCLDAKINLQI